MVTNFWNFYFVKLPLAVTIVLIKLFNLNKEHSRLSFQISTVAVIKELQKFASPNYPVFCVHEMFCPDEGLTAFQSTDFSPTLHPVRADDASETARFHGDLLLYSCNILVGFFPINLNKLVHVP